MASRFDTNDFRDARPNAYWIERAQDPTRPVGGLLVYILSGAMLITALQARLRLLMLGIGRERVEQIMREVVIAGSTRYGYEELVRQPFVDGNWAGRTQTALLVAAVQLGAPADFVRELASNLREQQVGWRSLKFAIMVAYKLPSNLMTSPVPGRAGDLAKMAEGIEFRHSSLPGVGGTTNILHPPTWRRAIGTSSEAPRQTTVNDALGGGVTFTPGPGRETAEVIPPTPTPPATPPPSATPPPVRPPPNTTTPPAPTPVVRPPSPPAPTVARASSSGGAIAAVSLLALAGAVAFASSEKKRKKKGPSLF